MQLNGQLIAKLIGISGIILLGVILFPSLGSIGAGLDQALGRTFRAFLNLSWISLIALLVAAMLAPLEALGWWAGWYGDRIQTKIDTGTLEEPFGDQTPIERYVIYLDGICQSTFEYFPDVEEFLRELSQALPDNILIIKGIIPYSVLNRPLTEDRVWAFFWRLADRLKMSKSGGLFSVLFTVFINIRNLLIVAVSADSRYGQIYNQGTAQVMYNSLIHHGYKPDSGIPITLIGYSGGGQVAMGATPFLKQALNAPIEVISIAGVISGNINALIPQQLYHLVGEKDVVERLGAILFPRRWKIFFLSYWNRAKQRGNITFLSLDKVGHEGKNGPFDSQKYLPNGKTHLQHTVDLVVGIILEKLPILVNPPAKPSNYERYLQADFNRLNFYPIHQSINRDWYQPIAPWIGRLILPKPENRCSVRGVWFEVYHADPPYQHLIGQKVKLRWQNHPIIQRYLQAVTKDVHFSPDTEYSQQQGNLHPQRINHWHNVNPLESLAASHPHDDLVVSLSDTVQIEQIGDEISLLISREPVQITGRFYGLVKILRPIQPGSDRYTVVHYNRQSQQFNGGEEIVRIPPVIPNLDGIYPASNRDLEKSPCNRLGWYIYGAQDHSGLFIVQAIAPRALFRLQPNQVLWGEKAAFHYLKHQAWATQEVPKGHIKSILLSSPGQTHQEAIAEWQEGDCALVLHTYGGIGGRKTEPAARGPVYWGHFAYGLAQVIREPITQELQFQIEYRQVYTHNSDGIVAGSLSWIKYMGDRQSGWLGTRPVCDLLIQLDAFTKPYDVDGVKRSALGDLMRQLEAMTARYRIGDGRGGTFVGPANNCAQDSNQALYRSIRNLQTFLESHPDRFRQWLQLYPHQEHRFQQLVQLENSLKHQLLPLKTARPDWQNREYSLGITFEDRPLQKLVMGLGSWRSLLPRLANDTVARVFLQQGASVWVLRTQQVGGTDPDIEAIAPMTL